MKIILGLGNPGVKYLGTRHNVGFMVLDALAEKRQVRFPEDPEGRPGAWMTEVRFGTETVVLVKPVMFMNRSGLVGRALMERFEVPAGEIIVVYDDADLPIGTIRIRPRGGAGGHRGMESLQAEIGDVPFPRVRLGILGSKREETELAEYVLSRFEPEETASLSDMVARAAGALETWVTEGTAIAMNRHNGPAGPQAGEDSARADRPAQG